MRDALPLASFIGFTGTPIELADANAHAVFGEYISVYHIRRAMQDDATVPIADESRLAKLSLDDSARTKIDPEFEEPTEGESGRAQGEAQDKMSAARRRRRRGEAPLSLEPSKGQALVPRARARSD